MAQQQNSSKSEENSGSVSLFQNPDLNSDSDQHKNISLQAWGSDDDDVSRFGDNLARKSIRSGSSASIGSDRFQSESSESPGLQDRSGTSDCMSDSASELIKHRQEIKEYVRHLKSRQNTSLCPAMACLIFLVGAVLLFTVLIALVSNRMQTSCN